jgi:hypothetical protein
MIPVYLEVRDRKNARQMLASAPVPRVVARSSFTTKYLMDGLKKDGCAVVGEVPWEWVERIKKQTESHRPPSSAARAARAYTSSTRIARDAFPLLIE